MLDILKILEDNPRVKPEKVATMVGLPVKKVEKVIKEYEKKRIIRKYKTVIDWDKAGKERVYAMIDVKIIPQRGRGYDAIAERIMRFPEVINLYLISGTYDLSVLVRGNDMKSVASFVSEKLAPLEQVQGTVTHFVLKRYKEDGEMLFEKEEKKRLAVTP